MSVAPTTLLSGVRVPVHQLEKSASIKNNAVISYSNGFTANNFNGSNTDFIPLKIERSSVKGPISHMAIRYKMTSTSTAVQLIPTPYWVARVELWQNSDREIVRIFNDELFVYPFLNQSRARLRNYKKAMGLGLEENNYFYTPYMAPSSTKYFYLPLTNAFIEHFNLNLQYVSGDLYLRIYPCSTPINIDGNTSYTPSLGEIALVYECQALDSAGLQKQAMIHKEPRLHYVLHPVQVPTSAQSYAASTQYIQTLEAVQGKVPFFLWALRASNSNASSAVLKNVDLGDGATHQITTPSGADLLNNGSPIRFEALDYFQTDSQVNPEFRDNRQWYVTDCSNDFNASQVGTMNGFLQLDGSKYQFILNTPTASTSHVQTITLTAALPSTATYSISWRGSTTAMLAYNASASAMKTAFEALMSAQNHPLGPITVTFSGALSSGTSITATLTGPNGNFVPIDDVIAINVDNQATSGAGTASVAISTYGSSGFPTATTYQLILYAMVFAQITLSPRGDLQRTIL